MFKHVVRFVVALVLMVQVSCGDEECEPGYFLINGDCQAICGQGTTYDSETNKCVTDADTDTDTMCAEGTTYDSESGTCIPDSDTLCAAGTYFVDGRCQIDPAQCPNATMYNEQSGLCEPIIVECAPGTINIGNQCITDEENLTNVVSSECYRYLGGDSNTEACFILDELQPDSINDFYVFPLAIEQGQETVVGGDIFIPQDSDDDGLDEADIDYWVFFAQAGDYIHIVATGINGFNPYFSVSGIDAQNDFFKRFSPTSNNVERQIYIPVSGAYVIAISDYLNISGTGLIGNEDYRYYITVTNLGRPIVSDITETTPVTKVGSHGSLAFYTMPVSQNMRYVFTHTIVGSGSMTPAIMLLKDNQYYVQAVSTNEYLEWERVQTDVTIFNETTNNVQVVVDYYDAANPQNQAYQLLIESYQQQVFDGESLQYLSPSITDSELYAIRQWNQVIFDGNQDDVMFLTVTDRDVKYIDEVEDNDSFTNAMMVPLSLDYITAEISMAADNDYFTFVVEEEAEYVFQTYPSFGDDNVRDTYIYLYSSTQQELANDDDIGNGNQYSRITETLSPGTYYLMVRGYSSSNTGDYMVRLVASEQVIANDFSVSVKDKDSNQLFTTITSGDTISGAFRLPETGIYTIEFQNTGVEVGETYSIYMTLEKVASSYLGSATAILPIVGNDVYVQGTGNEANWYTFDAEARSIIEFSISDFCKFVTSADDLELVVYDPQKTTFENSDPPNGNNTPVQVNDPYVIDFGDGTTELITATVYTKYAGQQYFSVGAVDGASFDYVITTTIPEILGQSIENPGRTNQNINNAGDYIPYSLDVLAGQEVSITVTLHENCDVNICLFDQTLTCVDTADAGTEGEQEQYERRIVTDADMLFGVNRNDDTYTDGPCTFDVSVITASYSEDEPNDTMNQATSITPLGYRHTMIGTIEPAGDIDVYSFTTEYVKYIELETRAGSDPLPSGDTYLALYDHQGQLIAEHEDIDPLGDPEWNEPPIKYSEIEKIIPAGTYYIVVRSSPNYAPQETGDYSLNLMLYTYEEEYNDANSDGIANDINPSNYELLSNYWAVFGTLDSSSDVDCYYYDDSFIDTEASFAVHNGPETESIDDVTNPVFELFDNNGVLLSGTGGWDSSNELYLWTYTSLLSGPKYFCLHDNDGSQYNYGITLRY